MTKTTKSDTTEPTTQLDEPGPPGQPDPKLGQRARSGDLVSELGALPPLPALEGVRANAAAGYYKTRPADDLVVDLEGVSFESDEHGKVRDALVERAKGGAFSAPSAPSQPSQR